LITSNRTVCAAAALVCLVASRPVAAQIGDLGPKAGTVSVAAPVFLVPDEKRVPLRTLPAGTSVLVGPIKGDWVQVTFNDQQFGRRTGWMQRQFVRFDATPPPDRPEMTLPPAAPTGTPGRQAPAVTQRARRAQRLGVRGFALFAADKMAADESFQALSGSASPRSFGGGVQVTNLFHGLFAEVSAERSSVNGERVFVHEGEVFRLGIPVRITTTPIDVIAGWRSAPIDRVTAFAGGGVSLMSFKETSDFADADENVDKRSRGLVVLAGMEVQVWRWIHVRGDMRYRRVTDLLGAGGVSAQFGETTFGGFGGSVKVAVGR